LPSLDKLTRDELNDKAEKLGVEGAVQMKNRRAVIEAIRARQEEFEGVSPDLFSRGARVINVYHGRTVIEVSTDLASYLFEQPLGQSGRTDAVAAVEADLALIRSRDPKVADSGIAAGALQMAHEIEDPYNSATSKSMCMKSLQQAMDRLLELSPPGQEEEGRLYELKVGRAKRRSAA
jgi:hypothetical protein